MPRKPGRVLVISQPPSFEISGSRTLGRSFAPMVPRSTAATPNTAFNFSSTAVGTAAFAAVVAVSLISFSCSASNAIVVSCSALSVFHLDADARRGLNHRLGRVGDVHRARRGRVRDGADDDGPVGIAV